MTASPSSSTPPPTRHLALRIVTMPKDTNHYGTIFGGVILSYIDQAGYVEARRHGTAAAQTWVTVALDRVEFKHPVHVGDTVSFYATPTRLGTTSITIKIEVEAERFNTGEHVGVTEASITLVCVNDCGKPIPFRGS
jgi:acyl-CoA thioesterase YciA